MILRRVIEHVKAQNWMAVALDFVIVVAGILIAFQITEWNAQRADKLRERQIVADMLTDLAIDRAQYEAAKTVAVRRVSAANASLQGAGLAPVEFYYAMPNIERVSYSDAILKAARETPVERENLWTHVVIGYFPTPSTSTYDAIVGGGDIKIIRDRNLVREIQAYGNLVGSVIMQNEKLTALRRDTMNAGAKYGLAPYRSMNADEYFRLIEKQPDLAAAIRISATFTVFHHGEVESADKQAEILQESLNQYLGEAR